MNDEDLIRDMERATRRLDDSLKVCRKIISSYRSSLTRVAGESAVDGPALFDWPAGSRDLARTEEDIVAPEGGPRPNPDLSTGR